MCQRWHEVSRKVSLKKIVASIKTQHHLLIPEKTFSLIGVLPPYVTHINLSFENLLDYWFIDFVDFTKEVGKFPSLKVVVLRGIKFQIPQYYFDLLTQLPKSVRVLVLHESHFIKCENQKDIVHEIPEIEILDLSNGVNLPIHLSMFLNVLRLKKLRLACSVIPDNSLWPFFGGFREDPFRTTNRTDSFFATLMEILSSCHQLQVLDLESTIMSSMAFRAIRSNCIQLHELYVCFTRITDDDLIFDDQEIILPNLIKICLRNCQVTSKGITAFMKVCPSLSHVYVGSKDEFAVNNFAECKSEKVNVLNGFKHCYHFKKVDYMSQ